MGMAGATVILIAVNQMDVASLNQGESLRNLLE